MRRTVLIVVVVAIVVVAAGIAYTVFRFVTFQPTQVTGLPASVAVGEPFTFQITGDLTIRNTTKQVTFDVALTPVDATRLEGLATLTVPYRDFGLAIPDSPSVDTVADDVTLELEFVAVAAQYSN